MPTATFSASQSYGLPSIVTVEDTSSGLVSVASRIVFLTTGYNTLLVTGGTAWPLVDTSISIDALDKDYALSITVQWLDSLGAVLYTQTQLLSFTLWNEQFLYDLTQDQTGLPSVIQDTNYYSNKMMMRVEVDSGNQALSLANDIAGAQGCYDRATFMRLNQNIFF